MKRILFTLIILTASLPASAQWVVGGGYLNLSDDDDGIDVSLGAVYGSLGYIIEGEVQFSFIPEVRVGFGVSDDTNSGVNVDLDTFFALSLRGQYDFESGLYLYAAPSYARAEFTASSPLFSGSVSHTARSRVNALRTPKIFATTQYVPLVFARSVSSIT